MKKLVLCTMLLTTSVNAALIHDPEIKEIICEIKTQLNQEPTDEELKEIYHNFEKLEDFSSSKEVHFNKQASVWSEIIKIVNEITKPIKKVWKEIKRFFRKTEKKLKETLYKFLIKLVGLDGVKTLPEAMQRLAHFQVKTEKKLGKKLPTEKIYNNLKYAFSIEEISEFKHVPDLYIKYYEHEYLKAVGIKTCFMLHESRTYGDMPEDEVMPDYKLTLKQVFGVSLIVLGYTITWYPIYPASNIGHYMINAGISLIINDMLPREDIKPQN